MGGVKEWPPSWTQMMQQRWRKFCVGYGLVVDDSLQLTISIFSDALSYHFSYINDSLGLSLRCTSHTLIKIK